MKKAARLFFFLFLLFTVTGCSLVRIEEEPRTPLKYTVVSQEDIPEELVSIMEEKKAEKFQMSYVDGENLYLLRGYGRQMTGGYSIQVEEVSASENALFCKTKLLGPSENAQGAEPSYPCIVLKIKNVEKETVCWS